MESDEKIFLTHVPRHINGDGPSGQIIRNLVATDPIGVVLRNPCQQVFSRFAKVGTVPIKQFRKCDTHTRIRVSRGQVRWRFIRGRDNLQCKNTRRVRAPTKLLAILRREIIGKENSYRCCTIQSCVIDLVNGYRGHPAVGGPLDCRGTNWGQGGGSSCP